MNNRDRFRVTVSRMNEGANKDPYIVVSGFALSVDAAGSLSIEGDGGGRLFSAGSWDGFEYMRIRHPSLGV